MKNKKKVLAVALAVCLVAIISFSTLAWFTDEDKATNTFEIGSIDIVQNEKNADGTEFTQDQMMLPIVNVTTPSADPNYVSKVVTISNVGENNAYVRTFIAVDARLDDYLHLDVNTEDGWVEEATQSTTIGEVAHTVYVFTYTPELATETTTPAVLKGVYLDAALDIKTFDDVQEFCYWDDAQDAFVSLDYPVSNEIAVYVATQAIQAKGFANANSALSSFNGELPAFN